MICFVCNAKFNTTNTLIQHLKQEHYLSSFSTFRCRESLCTQSFQNLSSYKKHLSRKHIQDSEVECADHNVFSEIFQSNNISNSGVILNDETSFFNNNDLKKPLLNDDIEMVAPNVKEKINLEDRLKVVYDFAIRFVLRLHDNNSFSRKNISEIQELVKKYILSPILDLFTLFCEKSLKQCNIEVQNEMSSLILNCRNPFAYCNTDYMLFEWLKKQNLIQDLQPFSLNNEVQRVFKNGSLAYDAKEIKAILMPLKFQFMQFFEKGDTLDKTLRYMEKIIVSNENKSDFIQGDLWKEKVKMYPDKILVPYFLYTDDFEINNPLSSHAGVHSMCAVYYSFPSLPWKESKLDNVFLAGILKSSDIKCFGNNICFQTLVRELQSLEVDGIKIRLKTNVSIQVHFILGLILGDNLGLNSFLGFNKSFSSNSYCRFCKVKKSEAQSLSLQKVDLLRDRLNYRNDILLNNSSETGIQIESQLNQIPSFHVAENYCVDLMHDVFEGICHYDICHVLEYFIFTAKYFSLQTLNLRKQCFEYGPIEIDNMSGEIKLNHIQSKHLKMTAREMMTFISFFPIMIEDLVPDDDEVWKFILNFIEIIDYLLLFEVNDSIISILQEKIRVHHVDYVRLFRDTLKPKHHNLTHYPYIIKKSGPVRNMWCFKFEANHKSFKLYSHAITSRKNVCLTLAKKYQLKTAYKFHCNENKLNCFEINDKHKIDSNFSRIISGMLRLPTSKIEFYSKAKLEGYTYKQNFYIACFKNDMFFF